MTKCKFCKQPATQRFGLNYFCDSNCAYNQIRALHAKKASKDASEQRKRDRAWLVSNKSRSDWIAEAQKWFNKFIRLRDAKENCISCGMPEWEIVAGTPINQVGGIWDTGHYLSRGAYPELRFDESNCHKQCKRCNAGAGRFAAKSKTVTQRYRVNLIKKIGLAEVERIEGPQLPLKLTIPEIQELIKTYKAKCKELLNSSDQ